MHPNPNAEINVQALLSLRQKPNAVQVITEKLRAKEMGPADHIRTKHEVKLFVESGDVRAAEELLKHVRERIVVKQVVIEHISQRQGERMGA